MKKTKKEVINVHLKMYDILKSSSFPLDFFFLYKILQFFCERTSNYKFLTLQMKRK